MPSRTSRPERRNTLPDDTEYQPINWKRVFAPKYIPFHIILLAVTGFTIYLTIKHDDVVTALRPFSEKVRDLPAGWLIPIAILIVISIPPLFGHEIIALLCGVIYGLGLGFAVVAAGTFLGEILTWFLFKHTLRRKAVKLERTNLNYGALARLTRDGGFWIVLIIRFSAIPSHFSTAVFSTCDVNFWSFAVATALTLPKQIFLVYFGVLLLETDPDSQDSKVKTIMISVALIITIFMAVYIYWKMRGIKTMLLEEQAQRRARRAMEPQKWSTSPPDSQTALMIPDDMPSASRPARPPRPDDMNDIPMSFMHGRPVSSHSMV